MSVKGTSNKAPSLIEVSTERNIGTKAMITLAVIAVVVGVFAAIYESVGHEKCLSAFHKVSDLFDKAVSSPGVFVVGGMLFAVTYVAVRLYRLMNKTQEESTDLIERFEKKPVEKRELRRFLLKLLVGLVVMGAIAAIVITQVHGSADRAKDFFSKWDQPEAIVPGFLAGAGVLALAAWGAWMIREEEVNRTDTKSFEVTARSPQRQDYKPPSPEYQAALARAKKRKAMRDNVKSRYVGRNHSAPEPA